MTPDLETPCMNWTCTTGQSTGLWNPHYKILSFQSKFISDVPTRKIVSAWFTFLQCKNCDWSNNITWSSSRKINAKIVVSSHAKLHYILTYTLRVLITGTVIAGKSQLGPMNNAGGRIPSSYIEYISKFVVLKVQLMVCGNIYSREKWFPRSILFQIAWKIWNITGSCWARFQAAHLTALQGLHSFVIIPKSGVPLQLPYNMVDLNAFKAPTEIRPPSERNIFITLFKCVMCSKNTFDCSFHQSLDTPHRTFCPAPPYHTTFSYISISVCWSMTLFCVIYHYKPIML